MTELPYLESLKSSSSPDNLQELLSQTVVLKLNGGLGTSMGLEKAKSLLVVKEGKTFLDLIAEQIKYTRKQYKSNVRFVLMNSFSTSDDTKAYLKQAHKGAGAGRWGLGWGWGVRLLVQEVWSHKGQGRDLSVLGVFRRRSDRGGGRGAAAERLHQGRRGDAEARRVSGEP